MRLHSTRVLRIMSIAVVDTVSEKARVPSVVGLADGFLMMFGVTLRLRKIDEIFYVVPVPILRVRSQSNQE